MEKKYLIWSIEHNAWWLGGHKGYTFYKRLAGIYSFEAASQIVNGANEFVDDVPNEAMVEFITK